MNPKTLNLGGLLSNRCILSGHISPSMISTPFHLHNVRIISRISTPAILRQAGFYISVIFTVRNYLSVTSFFCRFLSFFRLFFESEILSPINIASLLLKKHFPSVFRRKYDMILAIPLCMRYTFCDVI